MTNESLIRNALTEQDIKMRNLATILRGAGNPLLCRSVPLKSQMRKWRAEMEGRWEGACVVTKKAERSPSELADSIKDSRLASNSKAGRGWRGKINDDGRHIELAKRGEHHVIQSVIVIAGFYKNMLHLPPCIFV